MPYSLAPKNRFHPTGPLRGICAQPVGPSEPAAIFYCEQEQVSAPHGFQRIGLLCCPPQRTRTTPRRQQRRQNLSFSRLRRRSRSSPSPRGSFRRTTLPEHAKPVSFISSTAAW